MDPAVAAVCRAEGRVLVTLDGDFANIRIHPPEDFAGLVVRRLESQDKNAVLALLAKLVVVLADVDPAGRHLIVRESGISVWS